MSYAIEIKDLNYQYQNKIIFENFDIKIKQGSFTTILGAANSGKTTLYNILSKRFKTIANININPACCNTIFINSENNNYLYKTVLEKITFNLKKENLDNTAISKRVMEIVNYFQIYHLLERNILTLSTGETILIEFVSAIIKNPDLVVIDDCLMYLDNINKKKVVKYLQTINKKNKTTIINFTKNSEEMFYGGDCMIIGNNKLLVSSTTKKVFNNIEYLKKANLPIPFMLELSDKLKAYDLIKEPIIDINVMIDTIWK